MLVATALCEVSEAIAIASIVVVAEIVIGVEYFEDEVVGVVPSVV